MSSNFMICLAKYRNAVEMKFTCQNTGKLTRIARAADAHMPKGESSGFWYLKA